MAYLLAILVALLFSIGAYLMLRPHLIKFAVGMVFFTNATNLLLFSAGRLSRSTPPIIGAGASQLEAASANAVAQALILTAIVIGLGFLAFALAVYHKVSRELGSLECEEMHAPQKEAA